jgi:hypothetical protein
MSIRACVAASGNGIHAGTGRFRFYSLLCLSNLSTYLFNLVGCPSNDLIRSCLLAQNHRVLFGLIGLVTSLAFHAWLRQSGTIRAIGTPRRIVAGNLPAHIPVPLLTMVLRVTCPPCRLTDFLGVDSRSFACS